MLQACLNGGRARHEAARVPLAPDELATDAGAVRLSGATELHVHPRDKHGNESLAPDDVAAALRAIRSAVPGMPLGIGTGAWIAPGGKARQAHIKAWTDLPDYVSVNLGEVDAPDVMAITAEMGIGIEAGISSSADAERWLALPRRPKALRILVEIRGTGPEAALSEADAVIRLLERDEVAAPILLHGLDNSAWACIEDAARRRRHTRVGLEDVVVMPDGQPAADNAALVTAACQIVEPNRACG